MLFTKDIQLGINAIHTMRKYPNPVRTQDLAEEMKVSLHFLEQIMRKLRMVGMVKSVRGPGGGYVLARRETPITAFDVAKAVGRNFDEMSLDGMPVDRLVNALTQAFQNTVI